MFPLDLDGDADLDETQAETAPPVETISTLIEGEHMFVSKRTTLFGE